MIVMAADYVGYKIVKFLTEHKESISHLIIDEKNRGNFNEKIINTFTSSYDKEKIFYRNELKNEKLINSLENKKPKLGILAWWPYILKGKILTIPQEGWLNFHPGFLPFNRGKHPNFWCLVDETKCGVTLQFIDEGIDSGDIVTRKEIPVTWEDTGKTIYEKSREAIIELFKENFNMIKDNPKKIRQNLNEGTYHRAKEIDEICNIKLDEQYTARKIFNIMRGRMFPPFPTAFFSDNGKKYSVQIIIKEICESNEE